MIAPHNGVLIGLGALPAVLYYIVAIPDPLVGIAALNVVLITAALWVAFGARSEITHDHTAHGSHAE